LDRRVKLGRGNGPRAFRADIHGQLGVTSGGINGAGHDQGHSGGYQKGAAKKKPLLSKETRQAHHHLFLQEFSIVKNFNS
jgi:hypothetical protein